MTNPILEEIFDPAEYPPNLIREGATIQREAWIAFRDFLTTNYGIYMYPFNEGSGETFSGESLPDGVLSGIKTYRKETNIPKAPYALMMDEGSYARVTDTSFDGLTGDAAFAALIYLDGDRDASGAKSAAISAVLIDKASEWRLSTMTRYRYLTGVRYYTTTNAQSSTGNYALQLRYPQFVVMRRNAAAKTIDIFINGIKQSTVTTTGVGTDASNTNPQYFGSIGGTAAMLEGWQSTVWPLQEVTLSDQDIFDIAVELGMAQYVTQDNPVYAEFADSGTTARLTPYGTPAISYMSESGINFARMTGSISNIYGAYIAAANLGVSSVVVGAWYRMRIRARGQSGARCLWYNGTGYSGTLSNFTTDWAEYEIILKATGTALGPLISNSNVGNYVDVDWIRAERLDAVPTISFPFKPGLMADGVGTLAADHASISVYAPNTKSVSGGVLTATRDASGSNNLFAWFFSQSTHASLTSDLVLNKFYRYSGYLYGDGTPYGVALYRGNTSTRITNITNTAPLKIEIVGAVEGTAAAASQYLIAWQAYVTAQQAKAAMWEIQEVDETVTSVPAIDSSAGTDVGDVLTLNLNDWGTIYGDGTLTYEWYRDNGSAISGATSATYTLQAADSGHYVSCVIKSVIDGEPYFAHTLRVSIP